MACNLLPNEGHADAGSAHGSKHPGECMGGEVCCEACFPKAELTNDLSTLQCVVATPEGQRLAARQLLVSQNWCRMILTPSGIISLIPS